jgi:hypothetical protein
MAARFGVTRASVWQYLTLLQRLPAAFVAAVEAERDPLRLRALALKHLVSISRLPTEVARSRAISCLGYGGCSSPPATRLDRSPELQLTSPLRR